MSAIRPFRPTPPMRWWQPDSIRWALAATAVWRSSARSPATPGRRLYHHPTGQCLLVLLVRRCRPEYLDLQRGGRESLQPLAGSVEAWVFGGRIRWGSACYPLAGDRPRRHHRHLEPHDDHHHRRSGPDRPGHHSGPDVPRGGVVQPGADRPGADASTTDAASGTPAGSPTRHDPAPTPPTARPARPRTTAPSTRAAPGTRGPKPSSSPRIVNALRWPPIDQTPDSPAPFLIGGALSRSWPVSGGVIAWRRRRTG